MSSSVETSANERIGVYPGSFDPIHVGHVTVAERIARSLDKLIVVVAVNPDKKGKYEFDTDEKVKFVQDSIAHIDETETEVLAIEGGLTVNKARELGARTMYRGTRSVTDFEAEIELHMQNLYLQQAQGISPRHPDFVDTHSLYRLPGEDHISSSMIRYLMHAEDIENRATLIRPLVAPPIFDGVMSHVPSDER